MSASPSSKPTRDIEKYQTLLNELNNRKPIPGHEKWLANHYLSSRRPKTGSHDSANHKKRPDNLFAQVGTSSRRRAMEEEEKWRRHLEEEQEKERQQEDGASNDVKKDTTTSKKNSTFHYSSLVADENTPTSTLLARIFAHSQPKMETPSWALLEHDEIPTIDSIRAELFPEDEEKQKADEKKSQFLLELEKEDERRRNELRPAPLSMEAMKRKLEIIHDAMMDDTEDEKDDKNTQQGKNVDPERLQRMQMMKRHFESELLVKEAQEMTDKFVKDFHARKEELSYPRMYRVEQSDELEKVSQFEEEKKKEALIKSANVLTKQGNNTNRSSNKNDDDDEEQNISDADSNIVLLKNAHRGNNTNTIDNKNNNFYHNYSKKLKLSEHMEIDPAAAQALRKNQQRLIFEKYLNKRPANQFQVALSGGGKNSNLEVIKKFVEDFSGASPYKNEEEDEKDNEEIEQDVEEVMSAQRLRFSSASRARRRDQTVEENDNNNNDDIDGEETRTDDTDEKMKEQNQEQKVVENSDEKDVSPSRRRQKLLQDLIQMLQVIRSYNENENDKDTKSENKRNDDDQIERQCIIDLTFAGLYSLLHMDNDDNSDQQQDNSSSSLQPTTLLDILQMIQNRGTSFMTTLDDKNDDTVLSNLLSEVDATVAYIKKLEGEKLRHEKELFEQSLVIQQQLEQSQKQEKLRSILDVPKMEHEDDDEEEAEEEPEEEEEFQEEEEEEEEEDHQVQQLDSARERQLIQESERELREIEAHSKTFESEPILTSRTQQKFHDLVLSETSMMSKRKEQPKITKIEIEDQNNIEEKEEEEDLQQFINVDDSLFSDPAVDISLTTNTSEDEEIAGASHLISWPKNCRALVGAPIVSRPLLRNLRHDDETNEQPQKDHHHLARSRFRHLEALSAARNHKLQQSEQEEAQQSKLLEEEKLNERKIIMQRIEKELQEMKKAQEAKKSATTIIKKATKFRFEHAGLSSASFHAAPTYFDDILTKKEELDKKLEAEVRRKVDEKISQSLRVDFEEVSLRNTRGTQREKMRQKIVREMLERVAHEKVAVRTQLKVGTRFQDDMIDAE